MTVRNHIGSIALSLFEWKSKEIISFLYPIICINVKFLKRFDDIYKIGGNKMQFIIELIINVSYFLFALIIPSKIKLLNIETTRKISHILCGSWIFIYAFLNKYFMTDIIIMIFMIILMVISYRYNIFKGVERKNQIKSYGTIYFFIALFILVMFVEINDLKKSLMIIYYFPLVYGDAFAAIVGQKIDWIGYKVFRSKKTVSGNIGMFLMSLFSAMFYNVIILGSIFSFINILLICIIATFMEAISVKGTDNFTIPIITMFICEVLL